MHLISPYFVISSLSWTLAYLISVGMIIMSSSMCMFRLRIFKETDELSLNLVVTSFHLKLHPPCYHAWHLYFEEYHSYVPVYVLTPFSSFVFRLFVLLNRRFHIGHTLTLYPQVVTSCTTRF